MRSAGPTGSREGLAEGGGAGERRAEGRKEGGLSPPPGPGAHLLVDA